ncbi:hypothetical protein AAZX31_17G151700 [Glycine max]
MNLKLKSFEKWDAPEENGREGRRGRLEFFSEKENQETQQPHPGEGNTPEKNPHCVTVVLPEKDAGGVNFFCRCGVVRKEARRGRATQSGEDHEVPRTVRLNHHSLKLLKYWTWQFVVVRPVCSVLMIALQLCGLYPTWLSWAFTIVLYISVSFALYSLVVFYHVFAKELAPHKPLAKFLCIKGIVFFCFWQPTRQ